MLLFKLAVFLLFSCRSEGTNSSPEAYSLPKRYPTLRVKLVFYFEHILRLKTTEKSTKTLQTKRSKCMAGSYQTPPLLILFKRNQ
jgi:hypothetical protein